MLITSAPSRLPASSKLVRVRVEFLEEQIDQGSAAQEIALGLPRAVEQNIALRKVEQMPDLGWIKALDRQKMLFPVRHDPWSQILTKAVNMLDVSGFSRSQPP